MTTTTYTGSCHCRKVRFEIDSAITPALRRNCSLRRRRGALMTPTFAQANLRIISGSDDLAVYPFNTREARHFFCWHCGVYPFHQTRKDWGLWRANIGCLHGVDPYALDATVNDGAGINPAGDV
ncbi:GFA family protein [Paraburkholderia humisilvae]|uniref:CENP-V/GFA domain-containing protein n=1 Tax=Paraburkholderia humisilvae TaxID=627669 RepID=A0A6J5E6U0_9BURK|nr:GFA family protein [Paraburkholderia humisilvae]CAB3762219.1 hypothetical protein LMG29542_04299 [Paraburkholderia humisilvae]